MTVRKPGLTATLRELLDDGEWHDEADLVERAGVLVRDEVALHWYKVHSDNESGRYDVGEMIRRGRHGAVVSALGEMDARLKRVWKRGPVTVTNRSQGITGHLIEVLADHEWHDMFSLVQAIPVRPEVAIRRFLSTQSTRKPRKKPANRDQQIYLGSVLYVQNLINTVKARHGLKFEVRGKRPNKEYRLAE